MRCIIHLQFFWCWTWTVELLFLSNLCCGVVESSLDSGNWQLGIGNWQLLISFGLCRPWLRRRSQPRILIDHREETATALATAMKAKVKEWVPFEEMAEEVMHQLVQESEDQSTLERGKGEFDSVWLVGNKPGSVYAGLESQGLCTCRLQLQGQRLVALASTSELIEYYRQRGLPQCLKAFEGMDGSQEDFEVPDVWAMPQLCFEYVRTGDVVFCPAGMVTIEKAVETSISARPGGCQDAGRLAERQFFKFWLIVRLLTISFVVSCLSLFNSTSSTDRRRPTANYRIHMSHFTSTSAEHFLAAMAQDPHLDGVGVRVGAAEGSEVWSKNLTKFGHSSVRLTVI